MCKWNRVVEPGKEREGCMFLRAVEGNFLVMVTSGPLASFKMDGHFSDAINTAIVVQMKVQLYISGGDFGNPFSCRFSW